MANGSIGIILLLVGGILGIVAIAGAAGNPAPRTTLGVSTKQTGCGCNG